MDASPSCTSPQSFPKASAMFVLWVTIIVLVSDLGAVFVISRKARPSAALPPPPGLAIAVALPAPLSVSSLIGVTSFAVSNLPVFYCSIELAGVDLADRNAKAPESTS